MRIGLLWRSASRVPHSPWSSDHLCHFPLYTALPCPVVGRCSHEYYWHSVALGLAPRRPSHVPSLRNAKSDVGSALMPLDGFISHRPVIKACPRREVIRELSRASAYRRATDGWEFTPLDIAVQAIQL